MPLRCQWFEWIRQDPWANANRNPVEEDKVGPERGTYLHPESYGKPKELAVERVRFPAPASPAVAAAAPPHGAE
jgi:hypothetical protein